MPSNRNRWILSAMLAGVVALVTPVAEAVEYCTDFNSAYLTRILTDSDDCASYPCNFYNHRFEDAQETCGDEIFRLAGQNGTPATCEFCFWSKCFTVMNSELLIVPIDQIGRLERSSEFRLRVLSAPDAFTIFRGGATAPDSPPASVSVPVIAGRDYLFALVQNHTKNEAIADPTIPVFFSIAGANADNYDHIISLVSPQNDNAVAFGWEDLESTDPLHDNDLNDVVFTTRCALEARPSRKPRTPRS
jgi:hypothetical protein